MNLSFTLNHNKVLKKSIILYFNGSRFKVILILFIFYKNIKF
nr:MAG TPA: hypothetical protein [Caudoviricetes sp.]